MPDLQQLRVAILALDGFEECELTEPRKALLEAGAKVDVVSKKNGQIQGFRSCDKTGKVKVDRTLDEARAGDYDAVFLPGGAWNADTARVEPRIRQFLREMDGAGKPIAAICHAPWELISADLVRGRKLTSWPTIQDDLRNAGAEWLDREVVVDGNFITSRGPQDIPTLNREMLALFSRIPEGVRP